MSRRRTLRPEEEELWQAVARTARPMHPRAKAAVNRIEGAVHPHPLTETKPVREAEIPKSWLEPFRLGQKARVAKTHDLAPSLGEALRVKRGELAPAFELYQRSRVARTARIVLSAREMGRIFHAKGVERLVRNDLWKGRTPERFYDAMEWLYGWRVETCLAA